MTAGTTGHERIIASFNAQKMMHTFGASLREISTGNCIIDAPILPECTQQHGFGHAALAFGIGDSAAGYAALSVMPEGAEVLTAEMKINLLSPATGEKLIARGHVLKPGRRLVIVQADVHALQNGHETHVAALQGTMIPVFAT